MTAKFPPPLLVPNTYDDGQLLVGPDPNAVNLVVIAPTNSVSQNLYDLVAVAKLHDYLGKILEAAGA